MHIPVIKPWFIVCFAVCGVFFHGVNTLKATQKGVTEVSNECKCGPQGTCTLDPEDQPKCVCNPGYLVNSNGKCQECECDPNGTCTLDPEDQPICLCDPGYIINTKGKCQECECSPHGTCTLDPEDQPICVCDPGYIINSKGKCQDPCFNNPCKNDGVCSVEGIEYKCECKQPYSGKQCEIHPCHANPCENEGACIAVENTYGCVCTDPFHGRHCENDPCTDIPCKNGGRCTLDGNSFKCDCNAPYSGKICEEDPCSENPCWNDGTCKLDGISFKCECKTPFFGKTCGEDPCTAAPCLHDGTCEVKDNSFVCHCIEPHFGTTCEKDPCTEEPCANGGRCKAHKDFSYTCDCIPPYFGSQCHLDPCTDSPCKNNGTCQLTHSNFKCNCESPYSGQLCEVEINSTDTGNITTEHFTTGLTTITDECDCGVNSVSCHLDWRRKKLCKCKDSLYAQRNETCAAICNFSDGCFNGGKCGREGAAYFCQCIGAYTGDRCETDLCESMRYRCEVQMRGVCKRRGDTSVCECPVGKTLSWLSHMCEDICEYRTCLHGRCEVTGNSSYICICDEGFTGRHCELSLRNIYQTVPLMNLIIIGIGIVIFSVGSIIAACWVKKLKKIAEEANKSRNA